MPSPGFYNENANRAYPFLQTSVDQPASGPTTIANLPNSLIVDAGFVAGAASAYAEDSDSVFLTSIQRQGDFFYITFTSNAAGLTVPLTFTRQLSDAQYTVEFADTGHAGESASSDSGSSSFQYGPCDQPLWYGYLVTGNMANFALLLPTDGIIYGNNASGVIEPALVQTLADAFVVKIGLANDDRTRATAPQDCPPIMFPYPTGNVNVNAQCLVGDIVFVPGYNATVTQDSLNNVITLGAAVGAGAGEPCIEIPLFDGEVPPMSSSLLEGGPQCADTVRSLNGVGGPFMTILAGPGVTISAVPETNTVVINVDLSGIALVVTSDRSESCS
jgi:hypothetical protein